MKQKEIKILTALIVIILALGVIIALTKGFAFELKYQDSKRVEINLGKEFERADIKEITDEVFKDQMVRIQAIEIFKDAVSITTSEITEEQKTELISKINEKYDIEIDTENIEIENVVSAKTMNIINPFIIPAIVATILVIVFFLIRYHKLNSLEVLAQSIGIITLSQLVLLGIMAITRMPIGRFTVPTVLVVYVLSIYIATEKFSQDLENKKAKENKK